MHVGDSTTPTDGQLRALLQPRLIESIFGLTSLTALDKDVRNLRQVLLPVPVHVVRPSSIPTSSDVVGPADLPAVGVAAAGPGWHRRLRPGRRLPGRQRAVGVPGPVNHRPRTQPLRIPGLTGTSGMADLLRNYRGYDG